VTPDPVALDERISELSKFISNHAGGVELSKVTDNGEIEVRFTGMCAGCPYRPVTMASTVRPALLEVEGVTSVRALGSRISEQAERRLAEDMAGYRTGLPIWPVSRAEGEA
jgi:Fe-S cluster biogenesis protein NfuA